MTKEFKIPFTQIHIGRFLFLLISILLMMTLRPFLEEYAGIKFIMSLFFSLILFSGIYAASRGEKNIFIISLVLALPALFGQWATYFVMNQSFFLIGKIFSVLFYIFLCILIMNYLFKEKEITGEIITGAICVYLLMGGMWASIFTLLENIHPGSFKIAENASSELLHFSYYSFVTLTTLGYGDITPITSVARTFSILEAIIGQLYIAILISRLVGLNIAQSQNDWQNK